MSEILISNRFTRFDDESVRKRTTTALDFRKATFVKVES